MVRPQAPGITQGTNRHQRTCTHTNIGTYEQRLHVSICIQVDTSLVNIQYLDGHELAVGLVRGEVLDVLVQVAGPRARDGRADDGGPAGAVVAEALVGRHQLVQLLEPLEQTTATTTSRETARGETKARLVVC